MAHPPASQAALTALREASLQLQALSSQLVAAEQALSSWQGAGPAPDSLAADVKRLRKLAARQQTAVATAQAACAGGPSTALLEPRRVAGESGRRAVTLPELVQRHVSEHGALLAWRRRVGAEHAAFATAAEDEAAARYAANTELLRPLAAATDEAGWRKLLAGSTAADTAAATALLAEYGFTRETAAAFVAAGCGEEPPPLPQTVASRARVAALTQLQQAMQAAGCAAELAAAAAAYTAASGERVPLPVDVARFLGGEEGAAAALVARLEREWEAPGVPVAQRIGVEELAELLVGRREALQL